MIRLGRKIEFLRKLEDQQGSNLSKQNESESRNDLEVILR